MTSEQMTGAAGAPAEEDPRNAQQRPMGSEDAMGPPMAQGRAMPDAEPMAGAEPMPGGQPTGGAASSAADDSPAALMSADELQDAITRWRDIQGQFVDDPRHAVQQADSLVADMMERITRTFADERKRVESRWSRGDDVSTEDLRQALQRYRSFFERLLAA